MTLEEAKREVHGYVTGYNRRQHRQWHEMWLVNAIKCAEDEQIGGLENALRRARAYQILVDELP